MKTIAFFNNKGGVGKTSLVYHLSWMYAKLGLRVLAADLDPQANLTSMFLRNEDLLDIWPETGERRSIIEAVRPIMRGLGDVKPPYVHCLEEEDKIGLIPGDLELSLFEDRLSGNWSRCMDRDESAFRAESSFSRVILAGAADFKADVTLIDVGPNLGAINRAAIISATHVAIPLAPDLYSLQGLKNLGPTLRTWRSEWQDRLPRNPTSDLTLPGGEMQPIGYIVMQHAIRADRPVKAYQTWMNRIPGEYIESILDEKAGSYPEAGNDPNCLAHLKHFRSLMPMAMDARKPMFSLRPADGAIGAHVQAVMACFEDFKKLAFAIAERCGVELPPEADKVWNFA